MFPPTPPLQTYDFMEFWAGEAWVSKMVSKSGRSTASLDIEYWQADPEKPHRSNHFDILTPSGFAYLPRNMGFESFFMFHQSECHCGSMKRKSSSGPRLAITTVLNAKHGQFTALLAIVCSSWTVLNMATSGRHVVHPLGREDLAYVKEANIMASR